eukprot:6195467-Pleurochrysis_carterae.AAC.1
MLILPRAPRIEATRQGSSLGCRKYVSCQLPMHRCSTFIGDLSTAWPPHGAWTAITLERPTPFHAVDCRSRTTGLPQRVALKAACGSRHCAARATSSDHTVSVIPPPSHLNITRKSALRAIGQGLQGKKRAQIGPFRWHGGGGGGGRRAARAGAAHHKATSAAVREWQVTH